MRIPPPVGIRIVSLPQHISIVGDMHKQEHRVAPPPKKKHILLGGGGLGGGSLLVFMQSTTRSQQPKDLTLRFMSRD